MSILMLVHKCGDCGKVISGPNEVKDKDSLFGRMDRDSEGYTWKGDLVIHWDMCRECFEAEFSSEDLYLDNEWNQ